MSEPILTSVDAALGARLPGLMAAQAAYYAANGTYFQGLPTHSEIPADGAELPPDRVDDHPTDQPVSWSDAATEYSLSVPETMGSVLRIDVYDGPGGAGWVTVVETMIDGQLWRRSINFGPEAWRSAAWSPVEVAL